MTADPAADTEHADDDPFERRLRELLADAPPLDTDRRAELDGLLNGRRANSPATGRDNNPRRPIRSESAGDHGLNGKRGQHDR